ncbi:hypothetical protein [Aestuariibaculum suncheonense]|uniref:Lipocalin-like domain-containing protein n=1 Tax=Aestuariibaculum suncheonense TaxID=1028745 RepID=A0A8J6ULD6_9FLAO|nr:hypothetical protein [Aestuariibaculum suncheonense]MBD0836296.1 hypothetical protein [Aestuariibaculum suncheonense]
MKKTLLLIITIATIISCSNESSNVEQSLYGTWNLINKQGGMATINEDYSEGEVKWSFNKFNSNLTVVNKDENRRFKLVSGTYSYSLDNDGSTQILYLDDDVYNRLVVVSLNERLVISDDQIHGFSAEFKK